MERILVFIIILGKRRASLAQVHTGGFRGMIEVVDIREHEIEKSTSKREEIMEYQG